MSKVSRLAVTCFIIGVCFSIDTPVSAQTRDIENHRDSSSLAFANLRTQDHKIVDLMSQAQAQIRAGKLEVALKTYEKALNIYTTCRLNSCHSSINRFTMLAAIGYLHINLGNFQSAVDSFQQAVDLQPNNANLYYGLGYSFARLDKFSEAKKAYQKSADLDPRKVEALLGLGAVLMYEQNYPAAALIYLSALSLKPGDARVLEAIASVHILQGQYEKAVDILQQAIQLDPKQSKAQKMLALSLAKTESTTNPVKVLFRLGVRRLDASSFIEVGEALKDAGDLDSASRIYRWVVLLNPNVATLQEKIGHFWMERQNYGMAVEAYRQWSRLAPNDPEAYYSLGTALYEMGEVEQAIYNLEYARNLYQKLISFQQEKRSVERSESHCILKPYAKASVLGVGGECPSSSK